MTSRENELIKSDNGVSSMRYAMLRIVRLVEVSVYAMMIIALIKLLQNQEPDWEGMAYFLGGFGGLLLATFGGKAAQKWGENRHKRDDRYDRHDRYDRRERYGIDGAPTHDGNEEFND